MKINKTEEEWKAILDEQSFHILREKGTERAFTGKYWDTKTDGVFYCAGCEQELFTGTSKFDSGCGWPSFHSPNSKEVIETQLDTTFGMVREEVLCSRCGGHLGHVFNDGPLPTGLRYCINSASIKLKE